MNSKTDTQIQICDCDHQEVCKPNENLKEAEKQGRLEENRGGWLSDFFQFYSIRKSKAKLPFALLHYT